MTFRSGLIASGRPAGTTHRSVFALQVTSAADPMSLGRSARIPVGSTPHTARIDLLQVANNENVRLHNSVNFVVLFAGLR
jgi:hypothetical protein